MNEQINGVKSREGRTERGKNQKHKRKEWGNERKKAKEKEKRK